MMSALATHPNVGAALVLGPDRAVVSHIHDVVSDSGRPVVGIDPGLRTGCKCAAVDDTGAFLETKTIHIVGGDEQRAADQLSSLITRRNPFAVAIGNGTGGREAESFVRKLVRDRGFDVIVVSVNEAGASVYSASDVAR